MILDQPVEPLLGPLEGSDLGLGEAIPPELLAEVEIEIPQDRGGQGHTLTHVTSIATKTQNRNPLPTGATCLY